jgi:hypothetical protein
MEKFKREYLGKVTRNSPLKWRNEGFAMLPNSLIFNENIGKAALLVFWALTLHLFQGKDYCFPSRRTLAKETRLSIRTIVRAVNELEANHYLIIERRPGEVNRYKLQK